MSTDIQIIRDKLDASNSVGFLKRKTAGNLFAPISETYLKDCTRLNYKEYDTMTSVNVSKISSGVKHPTLKENNLDQFITKMKDFNLEDESSKSTKMDSEHRIQTVDSELKSNSDLCVKKPTKVLDGKEPETRLLKEAISILESLDSDIMNSIKDSRKDMYLPKLPGLRSESPSTSPKASPSTSPKASPSTSPKASPSTSPKAKIPDEKSCFTCLYFKQMNSIYDLQQALLGIRQDLRELARELLEECKTFNTRSSHKIMQILQRYNDIVEEEQEIEEEFELGKYFNLDPWDAIGAVRLSTQMMYFKYLRMENDKYIQTFKLVQFILTQMLPSGVNLLKQAV